VTGRRAAGWIALASGAIAATGHAPFNLWFLALIGFGGLTWAVVTARRPALAAWFGGIGYFAVSLHWIVQPFLVDVARHGWMAPFALVFMAMGLALFWAVAGWLSGRTSVPALGWALGMSMAEVARGYVLTGFPWALPAYIWTETPIRMIAAMIGPFGLTALTLSIVALPVMAPRRWMAAAGAAAFLGAMFFWGQQAQHGQLGDDLGVVRLVQPNAPQHQKWDPQFAHTFVDRQIGFTAEPMDGVDLVIWPETAIPYRLDLAAPVLDRIATAADGVPVVLGVNRSENGRHYNAMITLPSSGVPYDVYDKMHLVPFGEYIPFGQFAQLAGLRSFAARDGFGFSPGASVRTVETPIGRALPLICYEAIFPQHIRRAAERPDYLMQITNDAWFGTFSGPYQHLQQARFRAVEQGLPMVRVANTGVSAVIDAFGRVVHSLPMQEAGFADVTLPGARQAPIYARTGDFPITVILLFTLAALIWTKRRNAIAKGHTSS